MEAAYVRECPIPKTASLGTVEPFCRYLKLWVTHVYLH